ncbi:hypothetical protein BU26DRAFT_508693 [Trematosphaeria pertusa]|uniref:Uncharacterized protein n=1 Tax=Trematosphaeria pertusa TaxID=390896 RepID=A0A6A6I2Z4_9PLEO|nr:uncharacterized protein BU26DRAFT_508693 [Trematosphaeria pertusa]KAF2244691.1 hypothetical protein BU26DRAFT_508693 [Trematosphaeria pertusa]
MRGLTCREDVDRSRGSPGVSAVGKCKAVVRNAIWLVKGLQERLVVSSTRASEPMRDDEREQGQEIETAVHFRAKDAKRRNRSEAEDCSPKWCRTHRRRPKKAQLARKLFQKRAGALRFSKPRPRPGLVDYHIVAQRIERYEASIGDAARRSSAPFTRAAA